MYSCHLALTPGEEHKACYTGGAQLTPVEMESTDSGAVVESRRISVSGFLLEEEEAAASVCQ